MLGRGGIVGLITVHALVLLICDPGVVPEVSAGLRLFSSLRNGIYPGTLWCGKGNMASNDSDLGKFHRLDACCRTHDRCPEFIKPRTTKYGLFNRGLYRRSHCDCDLDFYDCLKEVDTTASKVVGRLYFFMLKPMCFQTHNTVDACLARGASITQGDDSKNVVCATWERNPEWKTSELSKDEEEYFHDISMEDF